MNWTKIVLAVIGGFVVLCLGTMILSGILLIPTAQTVVVENPAVVETVVVEKPAVVETAAEIPATIVVEGNIGGNEGSAVRKPTYFSELSCSDLDTCLVKVVPEGYFTIGFKKVQGGCNWWLYNPGEAIPYDKIDEFHSYNGDLPLTNLDGFVKGESQYVYSCK